MKHYEFEISQFVDGELTGEERNELFLHLSGCGECQKVFSEYLILKEKSKDFCAGKISEEINKKAFTLKQPVPERKRLFYRTAFYIRSAAAILLLFFTITLKPRTEVVTKTVTKIDTLMVPKEKVVYKFKTVQAKTFRNPESDERGYIKYVQNMRTEDLPKGSSINNSNGG
jgi:hypothetical protein